MKIQVKHYFYIIGNPTYYECKKCSNVLVNSGKKLHDIQCFTNENEESSFSEISSNNYKNKFKVEVSSGSPAYNAKMAAILKNYRDEVNKIIADFKVGKRCKLNIIYSK